MGRKMSKLEAIAAETMVTPEQLRAYLKKEIDDRQRDKLAFWQRGRRDSSSNG